MVHQLRIDIVFAFYFGIYWLVFTQISGLELSPDSTHYLVLCTTNEIKFYQLTPEKDVYESLVYAETQLESILGILYSIFAHGKKNFIARKKRFEMS